MIEISRIEKLPENFGQFLHESVAEGFDHISVLHEEWIRGINRFEKPGEVLVLATIDDEMVGVGGITQDFVDSEWLRMRRFYVRPAYRRLGVGRKIALYILQYARPFDRPIVLHADGADAEAFWPTVGFAPITDRPHTTHLFLRTGQVCAAPTT